ncbi:MAG: anaerobic carbon-monoxide dehydrogenase iron sulfur subunit [Clostridia bacterium]|nr:anaerobic carbon-monoxide dehydrogenase iron sulfur subunit [Clostridia bacterium]
MPAIKIKAGLCTGCRTCELICSYRHGAPGFNPALSRIRIKNRGMEKENPVFCRQCPRPKCMESCPSGALTQDPKTGVITLDPELCNACGTCIRMCPFGAMAAHPETGLPLICDLCGGEPACVTYCPNEVLIYAPKGGDPN